MSGIAGLYNTDQSPADRATLERMAEALAHRGPDGSGIWMSGPVGLAHLMFHETPESLHERQPCVDDERQLVVTADARIDNRNDLIAHFGLKHEDPLFLPDSRLILEAYAKWGERCVEHLIGDFAFVVWDGRRHLLYCARDYIGVKPFYYSFLNSRFVFASEMKGPRTLGHVSSKLNEEMIASYLVNDVEDKESTVYESLLRLPPAHSMVVKELGATKRRYWKPDTDTELRFQSNGDYAKAFREIFAEAVRCRLRSAFPIGSMLSGGLDSSSVTCMARNLLNTEGRGGSIKAFSAVYDHLPEVNERPFQDKVAKAADLQVCTANMAEVGPLAEYLKGQPRVDFPVRGWAYYIHESLHSLMRQQGVRIALEGQGGDDVVNHGTSHIEFLFRRFRFFEAMAAANSISRRYNTPFRRILWHYGLRQNIPQPLLSLAQFLRTGRIARNENLLDLYPIAPGLVQRTSVSERLRKQACSERRPSHLREAHAVGLTSGLRARSLEILDQYSSQWPLATRLPFLDRRLLSFCLSLPHDQKLSDGWTRVVLRRSMEGILPGDIQWRLGKSNNTPHLDSMMRGREKALLLRTVERVTPLIADYVDLEALRQTCISYLASGEQSNAHRRIWPALSLGHFLSTRTGSL